MTLITLNTLVSIYKKPDETGYQKLIKRNVQCKKVFDTNNILIEQYIKPNGEVSKLWASIKEGDNYYTVRHTFSYLQELVSPIKFNGFQIKGNNGNKK